jgi:phytoene dehydrogenase-like protein
MELSSTGAAKMDQPKSVIVIGAGIAGLSAGIYAQMNGYHTRIFEMHTQPGGLMTAWKRKGYTIDGCIHWLSGSSPVYPEYYRYWEEIGLIQGRKIYDPEIFSRVEGLGGKVLNFYSDIDRLEAHLLELAPADSAFICKMCKAVRTFSKFDLTTQVATFGDFLHLLGSLPGLIRVLPLLRTWGGMTMADLASKFTDPFLRQVFTDMWYPEMTAVGLLVTLGMVNRKGAGYPIGGSLPMAAAVEKRFRDLGGEVQYGCRVKRILVQNGSAVGIEMEDGSTENADVVISAADGHATLFSMLDGKFMDPVYEKAYNEEKVFPSLVFIGLGVNGEIREPYGVTGGINFYLDEPIEVIGKKVSRIGYNIHNFDPTLAPAGKTVITVMFDSDYAAWKELHEEPERYEAEKERVGLQVIDRLSRQYPVIDNHVEMADVATPVTFERYTGNWKGSFEGWLPTPKNVVKPYPYTLPGLKNFYMVGQWVQPGGGLPSGVMTGRAVVQKLCKADGVKFRTVKEVES